MLGVENPLVLLILLLTPLPFMFFRQDSVSYSSVERLPVDRISDSLDLLLKLLAAIFIILMVLGLSGLYLSEKIVKRIGRGAQMVMLFDSSTSMDMPFINATNSTGGMVSKVAKWGTYKSKGIIARELLSEYVSKRQQDMFAIYVFSSNPVLVLPLTQKQDVIQSAIAAGSLDRGLGTTDLGSGLIRSLQFFENKPFTGSRIVMLVSDGAAKLIEPVKDQIKHLMEKHRVTVYWMYLRDKDSPGLFTALDDEISKEIAPEQWVHKYFTDLKLPYRAFSAENPKALQQAIAEVSKLQNLPIQYTDVIAKQYLSNWCYGIALALLLLMTIAKASEVQQWG